MTKQAQQRPAVKPEGMDVSAWFAIKSRIEELDDLQVQSLKRQTAIEEQLERITATAKQALMVCRQAHEKVSAIEAVYPTKGQPKGETLVVDMETKRQMAAQAQFLNLRSPDELTQIVLHAFLEMCEDCHWITFPLMLQQVETV